MTPFEWEFSVDPSAMLLALRDDGGKGQPTLRVPPRRLAFYAVACWNADRRRLAGYPEWEQDDYRQPLDGTRLFRIARGWSFDRVAKQVPQSRKADLLRDVVVFPDGPYWPMQWSHCAGCNGHGWHGTERTCAACGPNETVVRLAFSVVDDLIRQCRRCVGKGERWPTVPGGTFVCDGCGGSGYHGASHEMDAGTLATLSDALEDSGVPTVIRCPTCDGEGCLYCGGPERDYHTACNPCWRCDSAGKVPHPVLAHLRSPGPHVRGCWAVDAIRGRLHL